MSLDTILEPLASSLRGWVEDQLSGTSYYKSAIDGIEETKTEAKQALLKDLLELVGEDEIVYMASPPTMLPVAKNPHEIEEVRYQTNKLLLEAEAYKAAMVKYNIRKELRTKLTKYCGENDG